MLKLINGDCLIENKIIEDGSVDLILTDLPYGIVKGLGGDLKKYKRLSESGWDNVIDCDKIMQIANRVLRKNGKMILFAQQPFTTKLISKQIPNISHCYNMYWDKKHFSNCLFVNKAPVSYIEDVLIFSKNNDFECLHPLRKYFKDVFDFIGVTKKILVQKIGQRADHVFRFKSSQFDLCTEETYNGLIHHYCINKFSKFKSFDTLIKINSVFNSVFNLWEGNKYKSNILEYKKDYDGLHPTQKPVLLLEDLIKTFSNENNLVVDLTMGSGSTGVACKNTGRSFIGIELDKKYFKIAQDRLKKQKPTKRQS